MSGCRVRLEEFDDGSVTQRCGQSLESAIASAVKAHHRDMRVDILLHTIVQYADLWDPIADGRAMGLRAEQVELMKAAMDAALEYVNSLRPAQKEHECQQQ